MNSGKVITSVLLLVFLASQVTVAQVTTGTILGTVSDSTGAVIPGATVTVRNVETGISRTVTTDAAGHYRAPQLGLGNYEVTAEVAGFQTTVRSGITLTIGREAVVDFALQVGAVAERITVTGEAPLIETTSSEVSSLVEGTTVREMPLNGRSFEQLAMLQPGAIFVRAGGWGGAPEWFGGATWISVGGSRPTQSLTLLDGNSINSFEYYGGNSVGGRNLGVDSIREFRLMSNTYKAEYGRSVGAILNVVTRSGSNEFHGTAFEFLRNSALDAKNFFDDPKAPIPPFKRNQFGGSLGGPIVRGRTFFFGVYEGVRDRLGVTALGFVPSLASRQGNIDGKIVPVNPTMKPYIDLWPLPADGKVLAGGVQELYSSGTQPNDQNFEQVRIDHQLSANHSIFGRYTHDSSNAYYPYVRDQIPGFDKNANSGNTYTTLEWTAIISPTVLNTARFGFSRSTLFGLANDGYPLLRFGWNTPRPGRFSIGGGFSALGTGSWMQNNRTIRNDFQYGDDLSISRSSHTLKFGVLFERLRDFFEFDYNVSGAFSFNTMQDFLAGNARSFTGSMPGVDPSAYWRQWLYAVYAQDDWAVNSRLTLNLGLRYEPLSQATNANKRLGGLFGVIKDPLHDSTATLVKNPFAQNPTLKNLAPRFGFAWDVFGNGSTAVRGGFGINYEPMLAHQFNFDVDIPPLLQRVSIINPTFPDPGIRNLDPSKIPISIVDVPDYNVTSSPSMMQYNLNIQRQLPGQFSLQAGYVGSLGRHLGIGKDGNTALTTILPDGRRGVLPQNYGRRRNPNLSQIDTWATFSGTSSYHSVQVSLSKSVSRGFMVNLNYTLAKAMDIMSGFHISQLLGGRGGETQNPDCDICERGLSDFDRRHSFNASYSYALPLGPNRAIGGHLEGLAGKLLGGWEIAGITSLVSGRPISPRVGGIDYIANLTVTSRPDLKAGSSNNPILGDPHKWFDPSSFVMPPVGHFGNLGRNTIIGPGMVNFDFSLLKNTSWGEGKNVQFRAEFFNIFNHPNFEPPFGGSEVFSVRGTFPNALIAVPTGTAGRIDRTSNTSRQIQFGLKFTF